ncbi:hypothetical protein [Roseibium litorale]|uniref:Uncharacterized protein n=1 Tax=Roseibium litorale TaxID=2803841 RepID=A0ABR9CLE1_9HYPH|nr:hypothetical protein [Roseibium litorale]MBD8891661.1 hypothetical protein [Roseibium litorale]
MKLILSSTAAMILTGAGTALAHTGALPHVHPHAEVSSFTTVEMLFAAALAIAALATIVWARAGNASGKAPVKGSRK